MIDEKSLQNLAKYNSFNYKMFLETYQANGCKLGESALRKKMQELQKSGKIVRVGRGLYCVASTDKMQYEYPYSERACEVATIVQEHHPYLQFAIFELMQLNEFVNHQIAHNVIFLSIEDDLANFVFDSLKEIYPGKVLLNPTSDIYHQYWYDNMIVIGKLTTEAPKGVVVLWHTRIEKMLVDIVSEQLVIESVSESEYPTVYEDAFNKYIIDESCLFRYAKRRGVASRIEKLIKDTTEIVLRTKV